MRNDYEGQLIQKDTRIRQLEVIINNGIKALGGSQGENQTQTFSAPIMNEANLILQKMGGMTKKIYEVLLQHLNGLTKRQMALMCGYSVTSGSYSNALSKLRTMGLISRNGEIYQALTR